MKRSTVAIAILAAAALARGAGAQAPPATSAWGALAQKLAIHPTAQAQTVTGQVTALNQEGAASTATPAPPQVPNENPDAYDRRLQIIPPAATQNPQMASNDNSGNSIVGAITGLARGGAGARDGTIDLGRESDETVSQMASNLFKNPEIRRLLGDEPRFVYNPKDKPDPMLVPWVRRAAIFNELMNQADAAIAAGKVDDAMKLYQRIADLKDPRFTAIVQAKVDGINAQRAVQAQKSLSVQETVEARVELPTWVKENTTGAILTSDSAICLVGDYMLHKGEAVPSYPEVKVASITSKVITYTVKDKKFDVSISTVEDPSVAALGKPAAAATRKK